MADPALGAILSSYFEGALYIPIRETEIQREEGEIEEERERERETFHQRQIKKGESDLDHAR